jgi:hypothetical protein
MFWSENMDLLGIIYNKTNGLEIFRINQKI